jgi:hypothetical protein
MRQSCVLFLAWLLAVSLGDNYDAFVLGPVFPCALVARIMTLEGCQYPNIKAHEYTSFMVLKI